MKQCSRCREIKPLDDFSPHRRQRDGRQTQCKACRGAYQRNYSKSSRGRELRKRWEASNAEQINAKRRADYLAKVGRQLQRFPVTPQRRAMQLKKYYRKNRAYYQAKNAAWVRNNPELNRIRSARRHARLAGADGTFTINEWRALLHKYGGKCLACGTTDRIEPDHVIPISKGGSNWITNIQPLCRSCNASKRGKIIDYRSL